MNVYDLWYTLQKIERVKPEILASPSALAQRIERTLSYIEDVCGEVLGLRESLSVDKKEAERILSEVDFRELQRAAFDRYKPNSVLENALEGRGTILSTIEELAEVNRGFRGRFLPRKENPEHNRVVKEVRDLVSHESRFLRTLRFNGFPNYDTLRYSFDETDYDFLTGGAKYGGGIGIVVYAATSLAGLAGGQHFFDYQLTQPIVLCSSAAVALLAGGMMGSAYVRTPQIPENVRQRAEYIDRKREELF